MSPIPALLFCLLLLPAAAPAAEPVRLVVVVSVDQLRPDTLAAYRDEYQGGLGRLLKHARSFDCVHDHAITFTGPGHSVLLTGLHPRRTGIALNHWRDPATLHRQLNHSQQIDEIAGDLLAEQMSTTKG